MDFIATNSTTLLQPPQWNSKPAWKLPGWGEPVMVAMILFTAMVLTRRRGYRVFGRPSSPYRSHLDIAPDSARPSDGLLTYYSNSGHNGEEDDFVRTTKHHRKKKYCSGISFDTPDTSRFANNMHSRMLQRFPFLIEMFYWTTNFLFYRMTSTLSQRMFASTGIWAVAQAHGLAVLEAEEFGWSSFLFPVREREVQQWFTRGHQDALSTLNRAYALIHIPGTVGFIAWYYYAAPSHSTFATVRRTMTLTNFPAFLTFIFYPCMPPRLLPAEYGFLDTVRHDDAQSVWMNGRYVNSLAAMPSMHFGYAFTIGCTLLYHSGNFCSPFEKKEIGQSGFWKLFFVVLGIGYPSLILTTVVATANHYFLDAVVATLFVLIAFACNETLCVFLPLENCLFWAIRAAKPVPTTGQRYGYGRSRRNELKSPVLVESHRTVSGQRFGVP
ncbi:hypothetical protein LTR50_002417 [Elasticomyces elasticus]|nr:hypothetical protein LTR50_002417 [Elasticomyces elasticus]